jgi:hypothetical protein
MCRCRRDGVHSDQLARDLKAWLKMLMIGLRPSGLGTGGAGRWNGFGETLVIDRYVQVLIQSSCAGNADQRGMSVLWAHPQACFILTGWRAPRSGGR